MTRRKMLEWHDKLNHAHALAGPTMLSRGDANEIAFLLKKGAEEIARLSGEVDKLKRKLDEECAPASE